MDPRLPLETAHQPAKDYLTGMNDRFKTFQNPLVTINTQFQACLPTFFSESSSQWVTLFDVYKIVGKFHDIWRQILDTYVSTIVRHSFSYPTIKKIHNTNCSKFVTRWLRLKMFVLPNKRSHLGVLTLAPRVHIKLLNVSCFIDLAC